ncbi:MAG: MBL fold metallo-hydrolase [Bacteroidetes bacterium]|nr:MBL fold metallo-hydrolase [Bacteroidota bacterium]
MHKTQIIILGIAQDAGYPHAGCRKDCCRNAWHDSSLQKFAACVGIADPESGSYWLIDATPDIKFQMHSAEERFPVCRLKGVFITHAHTGHYAGLINFGKEIMAADRMPVFVMPGMKKFLNENYPWKQFVEMGYIELTDLVNDAELKLNERAAITPFKVPHRDEHSETVGFEIKGKNKNIIYIPDIDEWDKWDRDIVDTVRNADELYLDGTFYNGSEIRNYHSKKIPHPLVTVSMEKFNSLSREEKARVNFIHLNHTNPLIRKDSMETEEVLSRGFRIAEEGRTTVI